MSDDRTRVSNNSGKSLRILVVEDHGDTLQALSRLLTHFGHEISVAEGAQNAQEIIDSKEFDVVLCDIALPDGNGYDLIAEAKRKRPVKAVAITKMIVGPAFFVRVFVAAQNQQRKVRRLRDLDGLRDQFAVFRRIAQV